MIRPSFARIFPLVALALVGCGNSFNCKISGDNVRGHVIYGANVTRTTARKVLLQVSTDSFASNVGIVETWVNTQGLIVIPYHYCAPNDTNLTFRAFEDTNSNNQWDSGEPTGRYDQTANGNGSLVVLNLPKPNSAAVPPVEWKVIYDVDVTLDATGAQ